MWVSFRKWQKTKNERESLGNDDDVASGSKWPFWVFPRFDLAPFLNDAEEAAGARFWGKDWTEIDSSMCELTHQNHILS